MNKNLYIFFIILLVLAFCAGVYMSLEAGETISKTLVRASPIFLVMFILRHLRKMDIDTEKKQLEKNSQKNNAE